MQMFEKGIRNPAPNLDHTWPQPPIKLEDPFGNTMYISSDFNWDVSCSQRAMHNLEAEPVLRCSKQSFKPSLRKG
jgi:hypothetical protein